MKRLFPILAALLVCAASSAQQAPDYSAYILSPGITERKMKGQWWEIQ